MSYREVVNVNLEKQAAFKIEYRGNEHFSGFLRLFVSDVEDAQNGDQNAQANICHEAKKWLNSHRAMRLGVVNWSDLKIVSSTDIKS